MFVFLKREYLIPILSLAIVFTFSTYGYSSGWSIFNKVDNYDECILENMKGVNSDLAAEQVRSSCERIYYDTSPRGKFEISQKKEREKSEEKKHRMNEDARARARARIRDESRMKMSISELRRNITFVDCEANKDRYPALIEYGCGRFFTHENMKNKCRDVSSEDRKDCKILYDIFLNQFK